MSLNNFTNNVRRQEILERLGIEQLPPLMPGEEYAHAEPERGGSVPMVMLPVPGRKCPACLAKGETVWVIPGKCCPQCGTPVN
ncbi:uncharacterized protein K452DRAFT_294082 [Aplosporella prunicola CBS 121167]|uniref:Uncharacterized protein n=1 Tax=Aplosporella prunicola CBS 121167 TaxID=1176127 RepID=A0A6A6BTE2_9PEZI|nr:uncharacterized protein K452DRAFT_294082 [Aplosporella prunicola CBS 121167]KAF2146514.1 hypothetical protein K452DRAFT_294082 [Aplosporella prunicola CBS 121167]